jgi:hypothetical protein
MKKRKKIKGIKKPGILHRVLGISIGEKIPIIKSKIMSKLKKKA